MKRNLKELSLNSSCIQLDRCSWMKACPKKVWKTDSHDPRGRAAFYSDLFLHATHRRQKQKTLRWTVDKLRLRSKRRDESARWVHIQYWLKVQFLIQLFPDRSTKGLTNYTFTSVTTRTNSMTIQHFKAPRTQLQSRFLSLSCSMKKCLNEKRASQKRGKN